VSKILVHEIEEDLGESSAGGGHRFYTLVTSGKDREELMENAHIHEIDQEGEQVASGPVGNYPRRVVDCVERVIDRKLEVKN
jgi:hypothetical protein